MTANFDAIQDRLASVDFYVRRARKMSQICLTLALVLIGLTTVNIHFALNPPEPLYFATAPGRPPIPLTVLSRQLQTGEKAKAFAKDLVTKAFNFRFDDIATKLSDALPMFTRRAGDAFRREVQEDLLRQIRTQKQILTTVVDGEPVIVSEAIIDEVYTWVIELQVEMTFDSGLEKVTQLKPVTVTVVEVPLSGQERNSVKADRLIIGGAPRARQR